jgi:hypothetical protein
MHSDWLNKKVASNCNYRVVSIGDRSPKIDGVGRKAILLMTYTDTYLGHDPSFLLLVSTITIFSFPLWV